MIDLFETARALQAFCDKQPRVTRDVDLTLLTGFGGEDDFLPLTRREL